MATLVFQIVNTLLILLIFIGLPIFFIKRQNKKNQIEINLLQLEERLKAVEAQGEIGPKY